MISRIALNRATLARQLLLRRHSLTALEAVEHLVGLQAQAPFPPYFGLWCRLSGFRPQELAELLTGRQVVRIVLMRGTVHLVSAADCLWLRPLTQPMLTRSFQHAFGARIAGADQDAVVKAGLELLREGPMTAAALGTALAGAFPGTAAADLSQILRSLAALVQVPPRAVWGKSGQAAYATAEAWLGREPHAEPSPEELVLRYLRAFGPATVADVQAWSGLTGLREVVERLRPRLVMLSDTMFDLPDAPRPDQDVPAPVRLLAPFDNLLLSHADRTRVIADEHRRRVITVNGQVHGTVLIDGFVQGIWKRDKTTVTVEPFAPFTDDQAEQVHAEAAALLEFAEPGKAHRIEGL
ncbi:winged helix DNA-binding domain-containing protein [Nonomuraea antri]|uniref:winged helix DNA-binding domain-containing protein n=1 Tax=Nonomuraea antri TaxID=2730852 RepID=UPI001F483399|nr:winged helix DNA-binding domain-containing protein [Nonomuraea antri]